MEKEHIIKALETCQEAMICAVTDRSNNTYFVTNADALALIKELEEENERLRADNEAAVDDLKNCMYYAEPKNNNTCNFCSHDCESGMCRGREDWTECNPVWRGVVKEKAEGER